MLINQPASLRILCSLTPGSCSGPCMVQGKEEGEDDVHGQRRNLPLDGKEKILAAVRGPPQLQEWL